MTVAIVVAVAILLRHEIVVLYIIMLEYFDSLNNLSLLTQSTVIPMHLFRLLSEFDGALAALVFLVGVVVLLVIVNCCFLLFYEFSSIHLHIRPAALQVHRRHQAAAMRRQVATLVLRDD